jgi:hypothetical protein
MRLFFIVGGVPVVKAASSDQKLLFKASRDVHFGVDLLRPRFLLKAWPSLLSSFFLCFVSPDAGNFYYDLVAFLVMHRKHLMKYV